MEKMMSVYLGTLAKWLKKFETRFDITQNKDTVFFISSDGENLQSHYITTKENGSIFEWKMQILRDADFEMMISPKHPHIHKVLSYILYLNYIKKFGSWEYDFRDGEICLSIKILLEDATITEKQFKRIFQYMLIVGAKDACDIKYILNTGKLPKEVL